MSDFGSTADPPRTPAEVLHKLAGSPEFPGCTKVQELCAICGQRAARTLSYSKWQGANFTDQNKMSRIDAEAVCESCAWAHSWVVPPGHPPPEAGKKGVCLRHFSHLWDEVNGYHYWNKADKPAILAWLRQPKAGAWFAAVADSGQKHVIAQTPLNPAGACPGLVRFEERCVEVGDWALLDDVVALLTAKVTKEELETARYRTTSMIENREGVRRFESRWSRIRGGHWFALCLWLGQRGEA